MESGAASRHLALLQSSVLHTCHRRPFRFIISLYIAKQVPTCFSMLTHTHSWVLFLLIK